ncbi:MAG: protein translocase subunit SecD [Myxococcota bacterium]|nr:protein translocase subunit SecD [Myxococcota bacterium]
MNKKREWKPILTIILVVYCLAYVAPTFVNAPEGWKQLSYGLDLQGGLELRYTVDYKRAIGDNTWKVAGLFRDRLIAKKLDKLEDQDGITSEELETLRATVTLERVDHKQVLVTVGDDLKETLSDAGDSFIEDWVDRKFARGSATENSMVLVLKYEESQRLKDEIVNQTMDIIRKRINAFGLVEPDVRRAGDADIDVQLPGVEKSKMSLVRAMIGQTAQLNFRLLELTGNPLTNIAADLDAYKKVNEGKAITIEVLNDAQRGGTYVQAQRKSELLRFFRFVDEQRASRSEGPLVDADHMFGYQSLTKMEGGKETVIGWRTHYILRNMRVNKGTGSERAVSISGDRITRAQVSYDEKGAPYASIDFDGQGAKDFGDLTTENVDQYLAIMLDDEVRSAPVIEEPITGGRARVTLGASSGPQAVQEAQALVTVLTTGAYKAPVHKVHDHSVGPSLGQASIDAGVLALLVGAVLVVLFVIFYYRVSGAVAILALSLNVLFVLTLLVSFNAALTLPGIAGIVLTIGMAVDANVIIFERIREELRAGKGVRAAVETGYGKAFWTIFDANITTALAGFILLNYTTGPIYGFAVTLLAGIASSMFTAIVVTRMVFNYLINNRKIETLSI